jgi:hypothetical protein
MDHFIETFKDKGSNLVITVDADEQTELKELREDEESFFHSDQTMYDQLEPLTCNSELNFVDPADTGDLTDAPMLGILDEDDKIVNRWAFMDYQVRSLLDDLADKGRAVLVGGNEVLVGGNEHECEHPGAALSDDTELPATWHCPDCGINFVEPDTGK